MRSRSKGSTALTSDIHELGGSFLWRKIAHSFVLFALVAGLCSGCAGDAQGAPVKDWSFLNNSYWYVPTPNLLAVLSTTEGGGIVALITDQTVFYIETYQSGYFWGTVATELTIAGEASGPNCFFMVGSVTPQGSVNLSFTPTGSSGTPTTGIGTMRFIAEQWTMENQMSTSGGQGTVSHWAYMTQCKAGQPCNQSLPGTSLTISQLLSTCN
jgi:hypothetical protein